MSEFKVGDLVLINGDSELGKVENRVGVCVETDESHIPVCAKIKSPYWYVETEVSPVPEHFYVELPEENREEWSRKLKVATGCAFKPVCQFFGFEDGVGYSHTHTETDYTKYNGGIPKLTIEDGIRVFDSRKKPEPESKTFDEFHVIPASQREVDALAEAALEYGYSWNENDHDRRLNDSNCQIIHFGSHERFILTHTENAEGPLLTTDEALEKLGAKPFHKSRGESPLKPAVDQARLLSEFQTTAIGQMAAALSIPSHILEKPMSESTETKTTIERRIAKGAWKATGWLIRPIWNRAKRVCDIGLNLVLAGAALYGLMYFGGDGVVYLLDLLNDKMTK